MTLIRNEAEMIDHGRELANSLQSGDCLALIGDLGAGKTHLVKGIVAGLDCDTAVSSPTFTLVHEYSGGRLPVFHFDLYRCESAQEVIALGWDEYLDRDGVVVVEWADKFPELFPEHTRHLFLEHHESGARTIEIR